MAGLEPHKESRHPESLAGKAHPYFDDYSFPCHSGAGASQNPEPMNTGRRKTGRDAGANLDKPVFMGSGLGPAGRPGMTKVISGQVLRRLAKRGHEGRNSVSAP
jgi:hypothetical protein